MGQKENADAIVDAICQAWNNDLIFDLMKENLFSYTSDGASVMIAPEGGVATKLSNRLGKNLYRTWCAAHR